jgi:hypothetical protein
MSATTEQSGGTAIRPFSVEIPDEAALAHSRIPPRTAEAPRTRFISYSHLCRATASPASQRRSVGIGARRAGLGEAHDPPWLWPLCRPGRRRGLRRDRHDGDPGAGGAHRHSPQLPPQASARRDRGAGRTLPGARADRGGTRRLRVFPRDLPGPTKLGQDNLAQPHLLPRGRQRRPLRRLGRTGAVRQRGARRVPHTALGRASPAVTQPHNHTNHRRLA